MITVEDLLRGLGLLVSTSVITDSWSVNFLHNIIAHIGTGRSLITGQATIVMKQASNHSTSLAKVMRVSRDDIMHALRHPTYKNTPYQSANIKREVRYIGLNKLAFRCKHDPTVVADIKALNVNSAFMQSRGTDNAIASFNKDHKIWTVQVVAENLERIYELIKRHKFSFDDSTLEYLTLCENSKSTASTFVVDDDGETVYANICNNTVLQHVIKQLMNGEAV